MPFSIISQTLVLDKVPLKESGIKTNFFIYIPASIKYPYNKIKLKINIPIIDPIPATKVPSVWVLYP